MKSRHHLDTIEKVSVRRDDDARRKGSNIFREGVMVLECEQEATGRGKEHTDSWLSGNDATERAFFTEGGPCFMPLTAIVVDSNTTSECTTTAVSHMKYNLDGPTTLNTRA